MWKGGVKCERWCLRGEGAQLLGVAHFEVDSRKMEITKSNFNAECVSIHAAHQRDSHIFGDPRAWFSHRGAILFHKQFHSCDGDV